MTSMDKVKKHFQKSVREYLKDKGVRIHETAESYKQKRFGYKIHTRIGNYDFFEKSVLLTDAILSLLNKTITSRNATFGYMPEIRYCEIITSTPFLKAWFWIKTDEPSNWIEGACISDIEEVAHAKVI